MSHLEQGRAQLTNGDLDGAITAFWAATQEQTGLEPWYELAMGLAQAGRWGEFLRVVETRDPQVIFFKDVCLRLRVKGEYRVLGQMNRALPENHIVAPLADYYAGVALIAEKRYVESLEYFRRFKLLILHNLEIYRPLLGNYGFRLLFRQGTLVEPLAFVAALDDGSYEVEERDPQVLVPQRAAVGRSPVLFACCLNDLYFLRFADSLVSSLAESCGEVDLHFHVAGKQKDCRPHFETLEQRYPKVAFGLSLEPEPLACHAPYYAVDRFMVMPQLAELYDRDIMMLDADSLVLRDLTALHRRLTSETPRPDFACFDTGRTEPASVYQATLMYFANSPGCRSFVRLLRRFYFSKLHQPPEVSWLLDQAGLFSVALYLEQTGGKDFVFRRLDELTGEGLDGYVDSAGTEEEKEVLYKAGAVR